MKIKNYEIKGCIFDLDGTLLNSGNIWMEVDIAFFKKRGMDVPKGYADEIGHIGLWNAAIYTQKKYLPNEKPEDIMAEWKEAAFNKYAHEVGLNDGGKEFLEYLKENHIPCCVVTANDYDCYMGALRNNDVDKYFCSFLEVAKYGPKSENNIYEKACLFLGAKPEEILVFDDLLMPLSKAKEIGFKTCAFNSIFSIDKEEIARTCDFNISSFKELINK